MSLSLGALSYLRVLSAIGIVSFHSGGLSSNVPSGTSLVVFLLLSFMLSCHPGSYVASTRRRANRLLVPWLAWWLLYAAFVVIRDGSKAKWPEIPQTPFFFLLWPALHLWYLPFVFVHASLLQFVANLTRRFDRRAQIVSATALGLVSSLTLPESPSLPAGLGPWVTAIPAIGFGGAFGLCLQAKPHLRLLGFLCVILSIHAAAWYLFLHDERTKALAYFFGSTVMLVCLLPVRRHAIIISLSRLSLGVYLIHPFAHVFVTKFGGSFLPNAVVVGLVIVVSGLVVSVMRRTPYLRHIV